jgi:hypothetical protein
MKTSVISDEFRKKFLSKPGKEGVLEGRAIVFEGSEDYHDRLNDKSLNMDENSILVIRGAGPVGWPGSAEVVNMQPSDELIKKGITELPCIGDGRQSDLQKDKERNGISDFMDVLRKMPSFDVIEFDIDDIVRSGLVKEYLVAKMEAGL